MSSSIFCYSEHKFNCRLTGLRKAEKMSMTMLVPVVRARQQPMKTLKQFNKWLWIIVESLLERLLMILVYRWAHAKQFLRMFYSLNVRQRRLFQNSSGDAHNDLHLLKKIITGDESWVYSYDIETKTQSPNGSVLKSQDRKKHVKVGQMWRFCSLFSSIAMVWCIMNSCHMVVRSIRNTTLKLCAD